MFRWILKKAAPLPDLMQFDRYLFIGPHPDDIEIGCAPTIRLLTQQGKHVAFLVVTDGSVGALEPGLCGERLARMRQEEARASAALLGVTDVTFLPLADGGLYEEETLIRSMAAAIIESRPDVIFAPDPDNAGECHRDHLRVGQAAKAMLCITAFAPLTSRLGISGSHALDAIALYFSPHPNAYVPVRKTFSARNAALLCHKTQFSDETRRQIGLYYRLRSLRFGLRRFCGLADGYRVLGQTHAHCFPEIAE